MKEKFGDFEINNDLNLEIGFNDVDITVLKMMHDLKRALVMNGATPEQADEIIRNTKIVITDEKGNERELYQ